jgi:outer membrane protein W
MKICLRTPRRTQGTLRKSVRMLSVLGVLCGSSAAAGAQDGPWLSLRPFVEVTDERVAAVHSFDANFGQHVEPFCGGGLQLTLGRDRVFVEVAAAQFKKTGDQVFVSGGQVFHLGIPMTATVTPFELSGGYRFHPRRRGVALSWVVPYVGAGVGRYRYQQTSGFADPSENVDTRHVGFLATAGAEFRVNRWVGLAADVAYTHIPGILGTDPSTSHEFNENDLGGIAGRLKIVVGK